MKIKSVVITLLTSLVLGMFTDPAIAKEEIFGWGYILAIKKFQHACLSKVNK